MSEQPQSWDDVDEELDWLDGVEDGELSDEEDEKDPAADPVDEE